MDINAAKRRTWTWTWMHLPGIFKAWPRSHAGKQESRKIESFEGITSLNWLYVGMGEMVNDVV